ncbi:MAG: alpha/beta hydrolase family esterase [Pseudomonadota bacterium]
MKKNGFSAVLALLGCLFLAGCEDTPGFDYGAPESDQNSTDTTPPDDNPATGTPAAPLSLEAPEDLKRGLAFLTETLNVQTEGGSGSVSFSVEADPEGVVTASIDAFGDLRIAGVQGVTGTAEVTVTASDDTETLSDTFAIEVAPYQPAGNLASDLAWLQDDGEGPALARTYDLYMPDTNLTGLPLVILLHGAFGNKNELHQLAEPEPGFFVDPPYRRWLELADREDFVVAFPNGLGLSDDDSEDETLFWNDCRGDAIRQRDDVAFLNAIADDINNRTAQLVDDSQIFIMGISNGGMMTYRLARETPENWQAVATAVANEPQGATDSEACPTPAAAEAPPLISILSTADTIMPYAGGIPGVELLEAMFGGPVPPQYQSQLLGEVISAQDTVDQWKAILATQADPLVTAYEDRVLTDGSTATSERYINTSNGKELEVITVDGGRHNLPSREFITPDSYRDQNNDIEAIDLVWDFFKRQPNQ